MAKRTSAVQRTPPVQAHPAHVLAQDPAHPQTDRQRVGVALAYNGFDSYRWGPVLPGWYLSWSVVPRPILRDGVQFAQMVRVHGDGFAPDLKVITATARANPGSLWLIGNEPDVLLQDNVTPEQYAPTYHKLYTAIKAIDPRAQIAVGGVGQPTPLRLAYLEQVLQVYRDLYGTKMPVDVWNVHAFILREERGAWGLGIPPGLKADKGQLYEIADHDNMAIFRQQIVDFRRWMAEHGQRDKPLVVTEYGILMPEDYGFTPERVTQFMTQTFDYFLTARDPQLGNPADDNRLVQSFVWFSSGDKTFPAGNLFNPDTLATTPVGQAFKKYLAHLDGLDPNRPVHPGGPVP
jgi:hypothetical protein